MIRFFIIIIMLTIVSNFSEVRASGRENGNSRVAVAVADVDDSGGGDGDILWAKCEHFRVKN